MIQDWLTDKEYLQYVGDNPPLKRAKMLAQLRELIARLERAGDSHMDLKSSMTHLKMECPHCGDKLEVYESEYGNSLEKA